MSAPRSVKVGRFRKRPVEVAALRWEGGETAGLDRFAGLHWTRADARGVVWDHDDEECVIVYNTLERIWLPVPVGHWIIRGVEGELYPCAPDVFVATYEAVE